MRYILKYTTEVGGSAYLTHDNCWLPSVDQAHDFGTMMLASWYIDCRIRECLEKVQSRTGSLRAIAEHDLRIWQGVRVVELDVPEDVSQHPRQLSLPL